MGPFLKQPELMSKKQSRSSDLVDSVLGKKVKERAGRVIGATTLAIPGGATAGRAGLEIAKRTLKNKVFRDKAKEVAADVAHTTATLGLGTAGVVLASKKMKEKYKKEDERKAIARKKEAVKLRNRKGKRGTQSGVTASTKSRRGDGIAKTGHTRGTQR